MRVTDAMLSNSAISRVGLARERIAGAQNHASSGLRVSTPSQDPLSASLARREKNRLSRAESTLRQVASGRVPLEAADSALNSIGELLVRAREIAIVSSNGTAGPEERRGAAREVERIREQVIYLGNTEAAGRYVFGGYLDDAPPFDPTGLYTGDGAVSELEVAPGVRLQTGVSAIPTFGIGGVGTDVLGTLEDLQVALDANDQVAIGDSIGTLIDTSSQLLESRATLGVSINAFDVARAAAELAKERASLVHARLIEIEPAEAYSELVQAERALEVAVQVAAQLPMPGLVGRGR